MVARFWGRARIVGIAATLLLALGIAAAAADDPPAPPPPAPRHPAARKAKPAPVKGKAPAKPANPAPDPLVHVHRGPPLADVSEYPVGVTLLAPGPAGARETVRVRVEPDTRRQVAPLPTPRLAVATARPSLPLFAPGPGPAPATIGPGLEQQVGAFGQPPTVAGEVPADRSGWTPTSAYLPRDPRRPYPWNNATFSTPILDPTWKPVPAWPEGVSAGGSRATWTTFTFDPVWRPGDAWGRDVGTAPTPPPPAPPQQPPPAAHEAAPPSATATPPAAEPQGR